MTTLHPTTNLFDAAHTNLLAGDWHEARRALDALLSEGSAASRDWLCDLSAYERLAGPCPEGLRRAIADRIAAWNR